MKDKELIDFLCEEDKAFAKDLAAGNDLISTFDGHFVAWDEIIEACGNGMEGYAQSPVELISRIINERDDAVAEVGLLKQGMWQMKDAEIAKKTEECEKWRKAAEFYNITIRDQLAMSIISGFAGNNAIFAANGMSGWGLVNCETDQLCATAYGMADAMLEVRTKQPE